MLPQGESALAPVFDLGHGRRLAVWAEKNGSGEPGAPNTINGSCTDGAGGISGTIDAIERIDVYSFNSTTLTSGKGAYVEVKYFTTPANFASEKLDLWLAADALNPSWTPLTTIETLVEGQGAEGVFVMLPDGPTQALRAVLRHSGASNPTPPAPCEAGSGGDQDDLVFAVGPRITITQPAVDSTVSGTVTIEAALGDSTGVARVDFFVDGELIGRDSSMPYSISWDTRSHANGKRMISLRANDAASELLSTLDEHPVFVNNATGQVATFDSTLGTPRCPVTSVSCSSGDLLVGRAKLGPEKNAPNTLQSSCADATYGYVPLRRIARSPGDRVDGR